MKIEQACRFPTPETGWTITAKSPGFTKHNEYNFRNCFSDLMNVLVSTGQSVLTCKNSGDDVYFAISTRRSDIKSRSSMFTHALVIPEADYSRIMESDPEVIFNIDLSMFRRQYTKDDSLESLNLPESSYKDLDAIREKYSISDDDLAELLYGAYTSLTGDEILCLDANLSQEDSMQLILDISYLITQYIPVSMRRLISFSSAKDNSCNFVVNCKNGGSWMYGSGDTIHFSIDPAGRGNNSMFVSEINDEIDMLKKMCCDLTSLTSTEKENLLETLEDYCTRVSLNRIPYFSRNEILAVYYLYKKENGEEIDIIESLLLILMFLKEKESIRQNQNKKVVDSWIYSLLETSVRNGVCPNVYILSMLLKRCYDGDSSDLFGRIKKVLENANSDGCIQLLDVLFSDQEESSKSKISIVKYLLDKEDSDPIEWTPEFSINFARWICFNDEFDLVSKIWARKTFPTNDFLEQLIIDNIEQSMHTNEGALQEQGVLFNKSEMRFIALMLSEICNKNSDHAIEKRYLPEKDIDFMNQYYCLWTGDLEKAWVNYLITFNLNRFSDSNSKYNWLHSIEKNFENLYMDLRSFLENEKNGYLTFWEEYIIQSKKNIFSKDEICSLCNEYNIFGEHSRFEQLIKDKCIILISNEYNHISSEPKLVERFRLREQAFNDFDGFIHSLRISGSLIRVLKNMLALAYYESMSLSDIFRIKDAELYFNSLSANIIDVDSDNPDYLFRKVLYQHSSFNNKTESMQFFKDLLKNNWCKGKSLMTKEADEIRDALKRKWLNTLKQTNTMDWDILFISSFMSDESSEWNFTAIEENMYEAINSRYITYESQYPYEDSVLLNGESKLNSLIDGIIKKYKNSEINALRVLSTELAERRTEEKKITKSKKKSGGLKRIFSSSNESDDFDSSDMTFSMSQKNVEEDMFSVNPSIEFEEKPDKDCSSEKIVTDYLSHGTITPSSEELDSLFNEFKNNSHDRFQNEMKKYKSKESYPELEQRTSVETNSVNQAVTEPGKEYKKPDSLSLPEEALSKKNDNISFFKKIFKRK